MKKCSTCKQTKPVNEFPLRKNIADRRTPKTKQTTRCDCQKCLDSDKIVQLSIRKWA